MLKKVFSKAVLKGLAIDLVASPIRIHSLAHEYTSKRLESAGLKANSKSHKSLSHAFASIISVPSGSFQALKGVTATMAIGAGVGVATVLGAATALFLMSPLMLHFMESMLFKFTKAESKYGMEKKGAFPCLRSAWYRNAVKPNVAQEPEVKIKEPTSPPPFEDPQVNPKLKLN
jgi:hypothetical protein